MSLPLFPVPLENNCLLMSFFMDLIALFVRALIESIIFALPRFMRLSSPE